MNFVARKTKVFAILFLIFANFHAASAQRDSVYRLPSGTRISVRMDGEINSKVSSVNDTFTSRVSKPIVVDNTVILPYGTVIEGRVIKVSNAGYAARNGSMQVRFESMIFADDRKRSIEGILVEELRPASSKAFNLISILGGTAAGAAVGAASGRDKGTLAGAGLGAGAGTAVAFLRKGKDVYLKTDEVFEIELTSEVTLPVSGY